MVRWCDSSEGDRANTIALALRAELGEKIYWFVTAITRECPLRLTNVRFPVSRSASSKGSALVNPEGKSYLDHKSKTTTASKLSERNGVQRDWNEGSRF